MTEQLLFVPCFLCKEEIPYKEATQIVFSKKGGEYMCEDGCKDPEASELEKFFAEGEGK